jgi:hypothetical protein
LAAVFIKRCVIKIFYASCNISLCDKTVLVNVNHSCESLELCDVFFLLYFLLEELSKYLDRDTDYTRTGNLVVTC